SHWCNERFPVYRTSSAVPDPIWRWMPKFHCCTYGIRMLGFIPQKVLPHSCDAGTVVEYVAGVRRYGGSADPKVSDPGWNVPVPPCVLGERRPCWKKNCPEFDANAQ